MTDPMDLQKLVGRSLPSQHYGAWIVDEVRGGIEGRSRLVTSNLMGEQYVWTRDLVSWIEWIEDSKRAESEQPRK